MRLTAAICAAPLLLQIPAPPPVLPAAAAAQLTRSLDEAAAHETHVWRDTVPINPDGTVNGYIEIARGDRRKWELNMARQALAIDRVMPPSLGGYPVNYGFVPQTVSYDGDPFDVLVIGPAIDGGTLVRGAVVGLMHMEDEKGLDSKVVLSPLTRDGRAALALTDRDRTRIGGFFNRYKLHEPGKFSRVPGWDTAAQGLAYVKMTHRFFRECRTRPAAPCDLGRDAARSRQSARSAMIGSTSPARRAGR
jgi:inorganic pyrophosphatase